VGILAKLVVGAVRYFKSGLQRPEEAPAARAEWCEDFDVVGLFIGNAVGQVNDVNTISKHSYMKLSERLASSNGNVGEGRWGLQMISRLRLMGETSSAGRPIRWVGDARIRNGQYLRRN
jgi:hypothetical protein